MARLWYSSSDFNRSFFFFLTHPPRLSSTTLNPLLLSCVSLLLCDDDKTLTKSNLGREGCVLPHKSQPIIKGSLGRNREARTEEETREKCCLLGCFLWLTELPLVSVCLRKARPTVGWTLLHQGAIKELP